MTKSPPSIRVAGLDLAASQSAICIIQATTRNAYPPIDYQVLHVEPIRTEMNNPVTHINKSQHIVDLCLEHRVDFVSLEEAPPMRSFSNTSGQQHSQYIGMTMLRLYENNLPFMTVNNSILRSFVGIMPKQKKDLIVDLTREAWGFTSKASRKKERSDEVDSFLHAVLAACHHFSWHGHLTSNLTDREKKALYNDTGKIKPLVRREEEEAKNGS